MPINPIIINIPDNVRAVLSALENKGFEAFVVGGCVRDSLMGRIPHDWDVTTNARPDEVKAACSAFKIIETGLKHGTVTVLSDGRGIEVTTYRTDGIYTDFRRPESDEFATDITADLSRRDFTINAMAYSEKAGIIDRFNGVDDLENKIIRCVGNPEKRFNEDALRIMRALRFSSELSFAIEEKTAAAAEKLRENLQNISSERLFSELTRLVCGKNCFDVLTKYPSVLETFIPEITPCVGFAQHNRYHLYDVWTHIAKSVSVAVNDRIIRLAMLFHDIGKPSCYTFDEKNGQGHFYGHEATSAELAREILIRLRCDKKTEELVCLLIKYHSTRTSFFDEEGGISEKIIRRRLSLIGPENFFMLLDVKRADAMAKQPFCLDELPTFDVVEETARRLLKEDSCLSLKQLEINGNDLIERGYSGEEIGKKLNSLLGAVIDGAVPNKREILLSLL